MTRPVRLVIAVIAAFGLLGLGVASASAATVAPAATQASPLTVPVSGTGQTATGALGTFTGTATITQFVDQNGTLTAVGTVSGVLTDASGNTIGTLTNAPFSAPVGATGTCQILTLHVGAIHLDVLGLVVDLAPIDLNITAQSGSGNLLGNLLCAVAHLLDNSGSTAGVAALLNEILGQL